MNDVIDIVKALLELDFICIDVDKKDTYIFKMLNDLVPFLEKISQLEKDVKRYFELYEQAREKWGNGLDDVEAYEYAKLHLKLSKVGKGE